MKRIWKYIKNNLIAIDQLINTIFFGDPDETISSRLGKYYANSFLSKILNYLDPGHVQKSIEKDEGKDSIFFNDKYPI